MVNLSVKMTLTGAGFAAALLLGCQSLGGNESVSNTQDTQSLLLSLAVKDSGDCQGLRARCARAHGAGTDSSELIDTLVHACVIDTAKARQILGEGREHERHGHGDDADGDEGPRLDSAARAALCDSLTKVVAGMGSTDSLLGEAKLRAARACFVRPEHRLDSASRAALCDSLKTSLAAADSASADYPWLTHETHEACTEMREGGHHRRHRRH